MEKSLRLKMLCKLNGYCAYSPYEVWRANRKSTAANKVERKHFVIRDGRVNFLGKVIFSPFRGKGCLDCGEKAFCDQGRKSEFLCEAAFRL